MASELERRLAKAEEAASIPDEAKARADVERFEAVVQGAGIELPDDLPTEPMARGAAIFDALVFELTGCHRPTGPDPVSSASEQEDADDDE